MATGKVSYNLVSRHHVPWAQVQAVPTGPLSVEIAYDRTTLAGRRNRERRRSACTT